MSKMYLVLRLDKNLEVESPVSPKMRVVLRDGCIAVMYVYKTKTAARKVYGRKVKLAEMVYEK